MFLKAGHSPPCPQAQYLAVSLKVPANYRLSGRLGAYRRPNTVDKHPNPTESDTKAPKLLFILLRSIERNRNQRDGNNSIENEARFQNNGKNQCDDEYDLDNF